MIEVKFGLFFQVRTSLFSILLLKKVSFVSKHIVFIAKNKKISYFCATFQKYGKQFTFFDRCR